MQNIKFYFDPICPFTWITSRLIYEVQNNRSIDIEWLPFSLAIKNNELNKDSNDSYARNHQNSHRALRLMLYASNNYDASMNKMYSFLGSEVHIKQRNIDNQLLEDLLDKFDLPKDTLRYADDTLLDDRLKELINDATAVTGRDVGVPIIVFTSEDDKEQGYFGPVLQSLPSSEECLRLWDGLSKMATSSSFYELKRTRPDGNPDVASTERLIY